MRKGDILMNLSTKILIGLGLGIIAGLELGAEGVDFAKTWIGPFGTIFMNMIKMIIVPLVFSSLVIGVCSLGDIKKIGRIGGKTMAYYLGTTAFAIVLGIFLGTVLEPGAGVNMPGEGVKAAAKVAPPIMQVIIDIFTINTRNIFTITQYLKPTCCRSSFSVCSWVSASLQSVIGPRLCTMFLTVWQRSAIKSSGLS